jgi:hypothetical protein
LYTDWTEATHGNGADPNHNEVFNDAKVKCQQKYYRDKQWYRVGVRFKGNSSLQISWQTSATTELSGYSFQRRGNEFYTAVDALNTQAAARAQAVNTYLNGQ